MANKQVARLLQPWLRISLTQRPASSILAARSRLLVNTRPSTPQTRLSLPSTIETRRSYAAPRKPKKKPEYKRRRTTADRSELTLDQNAISYLLPATLVAPPFWQWSKNPSIFLRYGWQAVRNRVMNLVYRMVFRYTSKEKLLSRPRWKANRSAVIPAAKALHLQMNDAVAKGDKETLRQICTSELHHTLAGMIDSRPKGQRAEWQLLKYKSGLGVYPRLTDDKLALQPVPGAQENKLVRQVVVTIRSEQRMARYDDLKGGVLIPGSEKVRSLEEHFVLVTSISQRTWEQAPWKIWGTLPTSTLESYTEEVDIVTRLGSEQKA
ncbi:uncharacterized protein BCR38DRAFT_427923 [Pseudomassariella vexata]|uniref:Tim44-like domain-containing protein n=1 Tax=Pseudomassariella vexata TaxID=1141098 RepID=A0A1Y2EA08_9PEZI|nr:uncharacterized protein BCR38DRAFT_427923 [Pseudomassariella vexata]ORY67695.1 hypothetical protein BCR38DRAFT_427923 [Pseudomassariella vexata]